MGVVEIAALVVIWDYALWNGREQQWEPGKGIKGKNYVINVIWMWLRVFLILVKQP